MRSVLITVGPGDEPRVRAVAGRQLAKAVAAAVPLEVRAGEGEVPAGGKASAALQIGSLVVSGTLSAGALTALTRVVCAFIERGGSRRVELELDGDRLVIEGASAAAERAAVEGWVQRRLEVRDTAPGDAE